MQKTNPYVILLTIVLTAIVAGGGVYLWQTQQTAKELPPLTEIGAPLEGLKGFTAPEEVPTPESESTSLLIQKSNYPLPFGAAKIEGYYTTVERATSLDDSTPKAVCSAFVLTDAPSMLMDALTANRFGTPPTVVIGEKGAVPRTIQNSTKENPIEVIATLNPEFEGERVGCMPWPFQSIITLD